MHILPAFRVLLLLTLPAFAQNQPSKWEDPGPVRLAILEFTGNEEPPLPPTASFREAIDTLERKRIHVVILHINLDTAMAPATPELRQQVEQFIRLFEDEYAPRFRIAAWVESALGTPALAAWGIAELYMMPTATLGAFAPHAEGLMAPPKAELDQWHTLADRASDHARRDRAIARSMIAMNPLSAHLAADIPAPDNITWRQDESGQHILNRRGHVLTLATHEARTFHIARGIAATKDELAATMGYTTFTWVEIDVPDKENSR